MKILNTLVIAFVCLFVGACKSGQEQSKTAAGEEPGIVKDAGLPKPKAPKPTGAPRILFIGNSHIAYYVSIPKLFGELCVFNKHPMEIEELLEMGISIEEVYNTAKTKADALFAKADADGNYFDYVILQEKTPLALQEPAKYKASVKMMLEKIKQNSPAVAVYIYQVMSPENYATNKDQFNELYTEMRKNAIAVVADNSNAGMFRVSDAIKDAYEGKSGYKFLVNGEDNLRFGENTLHLLNDGGFLAATLLYTTLFEQKPAIPAQMTFSAGTAESDGQKLRDVKQAVSNPDALVNIAMADR